MSRTPGAAPLRDLLTQREERHIRSAQAPANHFTVDERRRSQKVSSRTP